MKQNVLSFSLLALLFLSFFCFSPVSHLLAQTPQSINYQAVVRGVSGQILSNQNITVKFNLREGSTTGLISYTEIHGATTNEFGLVNLQFGSSSNSVGDFSLIDWGDYTYFLEVMIDPAAGNTFTSLGTSQLLSVPYALYAKNVEHADDADPDPANELNKNLNLTGTTLTLIDSGGPLSVDLASLQDGVEDADADSTNELNQSLGLSGTTLSLTDAGGMIDVDLSSLQDGVEDADADSTNELNQSLNLSGTTLTLSDAGGALSADLSELIDDEDWIVDSLNVYHPTGTVGIGTDVTTGMLTVGEYSSSAVSPALNHQIYLGGNSSSIYNQNAAKLFIGRYDNDGSIVYPIYVQDENSQTDFYLQNRSTGSGDPSAFFAGSVQMKVLWGGSGGIVDLTKSQPTLAGGGNNSVLNNYAAILGGRQNTVKGIESFIGAGGENTVKASNSALIGGYQNEIDSLANFSTLGGGFGNAAESKSFSFLGGGIFNVVQGERAFLGGGLRNSAFGDASVIAGGDSNVVQAFQASIVGGNENTVSGNYGMIGGGRQNLILALSTYGSVLGGLDNIVAGDYGTIPGGRNNLAAGDYSWAAGRRAQANHSGAFVWADGVNFAFPSTTANQFNVRATGGVRFVSSINSGGIPNAGVILNPGSGTWASLSDRHAKEHIEPIDVREVLKRVNALNLSSWNYKSQADDVRHIGPMAQDFYQAFRLGTSDTRITTVDADGVALAAIQGLSQQLKEQEAKHQAELEALKAELEALKKILRK